VSRELLPTSAFRALVAMVAASITRPGTVRRDGGGPGHAPSSVAIPAVDPTKPRLVRKALIEPLARSEAGHWWLAKQLTSVYADYEERAAMRTIQVVRLKPIEG
jgi:hypothetical protein